MSRYPRPRRSAFTLIELLVVVTIMAALVALSASASLKFMEVQQNANTQSTLDRVQSVLAKNWSAWKDQVVKEKIPQDAHDWIAANFCAGVDPANAEARIRVIYVKLRQRQAFPMNFNEALYAPFGNVPPGPCPIAIKQLQPLAGYTAYLNGKGITASGGFSYESSACLLMALERGVGGTPVNATDLMAGGAGTTDTSYGVPFLADAWGRPIFFTRNPAGYQGWNAPSATSITTIVSPGVICYAQPGNNDPGDPQGLLNSPTWATSAYAGLLSSDTLWLVPPPGCSYKFGPMVGSGGPGRAPQPGLDPVTFAAFPGGAPMYAHP